MNEAVTNYWRRHYVNDANNLCSLCGNTGIIDSTGRAVSPAGFHAGRRNYCICPNGQVMRENAPTVAIESPTFTGSRSSAG